MDRRVVIKIARKWWAGADCTVGNQQKWDCDNLTRATSARA